MMNESKDLSIPTTSMTELPSYRPSVSQSVSGFFGPHLDPRNDIEKNRDRILSIERVRKEDELKQPPPIYYIDHRGVSMSHYHEEQKRKEPGAGLALCLVCVFCGPIGSCILGGYLIGKGWKVYPGDKCHRRSYLLLGIFFLLILPAMVVIGIILLFHFDRHFLDFKF